uniref:Nodulin / glutamate-ammonia ligase n=1 Tax=Solanum tuberosum TaxID=4113 RepID=M1AKN3_SOLTU
MMDSTKHLIDADGALAKSTRVSTRDRARRPQSSMYLEVGGAKKAREVVFNVLWDACVHDDLSITEALAIVKAIFAENAKKFYKLDASSRYSDVEPQSLSSPFKKEELNGPLTDVTVVRVIWLDFSAQHRCRAAEEETWTF